MTQLYIASSTVELLQNIPSWNLVEPSFPASQPAATLGAYKIISCAGIVFTDVITAAIFRAAADAADVINLSLGGGQNYPDDITTIAADRVAADGHFVVGSAGNDFIAGMFLAAGPGQSIKAFSAAAFQPQEVWSHYLTIDGKEYQWSAANLLANFSFPETLQVVPNNPHAIGNLSVLDDGCKSVSSAVKGKTAILQLGTVCGSFTACNNAADAGAIACIMVSDQNFKGSWTGSDRIPTAGVELATGVRLATSPNATVVVYEKLKRMTTFGANTATSFSSPGLDPELHVKPDLGGIGDSIYTMVSPIKSGTAYGFFGGTSAAAPYLAANPASPTFDPKVIDSVAVQGAGLVNVYNAAIAKTKVTPAKLGLNDTSRMLQSYSVTIENLNDIYTVSHVKALTYAPLRTGEDAMLTQRQLHATTNQATVTVGDAGPDQPAIYTVKARSNKTVTVRFTAPKALAGQRFPIFSDYLAVSNNLDATVQHVPYAGVVGNWTDAPVLAKHSTEFSPKIGCYEDEGGVTPVKSGFQFNGTDSQINCFLPISSTTRLLFGEVAYMGQDPAVLQFLKDNGLSNRSLIGKPKQGVAAGVALMSGFLLWGVASRQTFMTTRVQTVGVPGNSQFWGDVAMPSTIVTATTATSFNFTQVSLPSGDNKLRIKALKHFVPFSSLDDDEPFDGSHGTSVAGVAAADGSNIIAEGFVLVVHFSGLARSHTPRVQNRFERGTDFRTAAIFRAVADFADVINMFFSGSQNYADEDKVVAMVGSAGNDYCGMFLAGGPGQPAKSFSAAAFEPPACNFFDGTSAASPYPAGSIALLLQQQRNKALEELQAALLNNATPSPFFNATVSPASPSFDSKIIDSVAIQGASPVNVYNAGIAKSRVTPAKLGLNDTFRMLQRNGVDGAADVKGHDTEGVAGRKSVPASLESCIVLVRLCSKKDGVPGEAN
ncbi:peptidase S8/S53 domain-containing protein [Zopfochytrium polystomum]|nr:peptidase S8/S53 domain-containing protein [Zopfochytrium polystomum]